jgi:hypothetical protein
VTQLTLSYRPSGESFHGNFKIAFPGYTSVPIFGSSTKVCIKQSFFMDPKSQARQIYDGAKQAELLTVELNCIGWASALMLCVYEFIDKKGQTPPFDIPQMRYVDYGLAISKMDHCSAFLLEEFIEAPVERIQNGAKGFVKYLNNNSAQPRSFSDRKLAHRAEFLSFAQHVQFWQTDGLAFVSDLQGTHFM